ncbi:MAG: hypothetical protein WBV88_01860 [Candidatus Rickettsiella isopodorum]|jgi:hypothetical protein|nr:hypothetical protein [Candidatus Rickettsiella isopodorum]MDD5162343.1 hypothetical protein [Candidatus Rickettsiella isopodorum]
MKNENILDASIEGKDRQIKQAIEVNSFTDKKKLISHQNYKFSINFKKWSLRRKKNNKIDLIDGKSDITAKIANDDQLASPVTKLTNSENDYAVIDEGFIVVKENNDKLESIIKAPRARILNPEEEQLAYLDNMNKNSELSKILHSIYFDPDLYNQIMLMLQFYNNCTLDNSKNINFFEIVDKVSESLIEIITKLSSKSDTHSLKELALKNTLFLSKNNLWSRFMHKEAEYETIEGEYEIMNRIDQNQTTENAKSIEDKKEMGTDYINIVSRSNYASSSLKESNYMDMNFFKKQQNKDNLPENQLCNAKTV